MVISVTQLLHVARHAHPASQASSYAKFPQDGPGMWEKPTRHLSTVPGKKVTR
jgi:hypothetical protein